MSEHKPVDFAGLFPEEIATLMAKWNQPAFRAGQLFRWVHRGAASFDEMTDQPKALRALLSERALLSAPSMERRQESRDGTVKYLWGFPDGQKVESVLMRYRHGNTVCISTQAGCRMGCAFCASATGLARNLTAAEMLSEVLAVSRDLRKTGGEGERVDGIVLMGTGEPLDNYDNVLRFLRLVSHPEGLNIGMRHISLSTCGLCEGIDRLAKEKLGVTLSVSLHAPTDEKRGKLMPVNRAYPVETLIAHCKAYFAATGRRISFEYAMIRGFNDTPADARELARLLAGMPAHVNLIPLNDVKGSPFKPSLRADVDRFAALLEGAGISATVRRKLGSDIDAACGQLRAKQGEAADGNR